MPSLYSTLCVALIIAGFVVIGCADMQQAQRLALARDLAAGGDTAGALLVATGNPIALLIGGCLIAGGHAAAGIIRHNPKPPPAAPIAQAPLPTE